MKELVNALFKESLIQRCLTRDAEIIKQKSNYKQLLNTAEDTNLRIQFLANYDALLRLIEILLLDFGYMLGDNPHSTTRRIIEHPAPQFEISRVISLRHQVEVGVALLVGTTVFAFVFPMVFIVTIAALLAKAGLNPRRAGKQLFQVT
jgi:hypothetical protein